MRRSSRLVLAVVISALIATTCGGDAATTPTGGVPDTVLPEPNAPPESTATPDATATAAPTGSPAPSVTAAPTTAPTPGTPDGASSVELAQGLALGWQYSSKVSVSVGDDDRPVVAIPTSAEEILFVACEDPACSTLESTRYATSQFAGWVDLAVSPEGTTVIGLGPTYPVDGRHWASLLTCQDPGCGNFVETRFDDRDLGFQAIDVSDDGTTHLSVWDFAQQTSAIFVCDDPTCSGGPLRIESPARSPDARLAVLAGAPITAYSMYAAPMPSVGVAQCSDLACSDAQTTHITDAGEVALAAGPSGPVALLYQEAEVARPAGLSHTGLVLRVWENDFADPVEIRLADSTGATRCRNDRLGPFQVEVGQDGSTTAAWVRDIPNAAPDSAPDIAEPDPYLGIHWDDHGAGNGAVASDVDPQGAGAAAGIEIDDLIMSAAGTPVTSVDDLLAVLRRQVPGESFPVDFQRAGAPLSSEVTVGLAFSELVVSRCTDRTCTAGTTAVLAQFPYLSLNAFPAITLNDTDSPVVAYTVTPVDFPTQVHLARCATPGCTAEAISIQTW